MAFSEIIGNVPALSILRNTLATGRIACGYLFEGPEGIGKQFAAVNFAKTLNCLEEGPEPCDQCNSCRKIDGGTHPDVHLYAPVGKARMIKVEQIKELINQISLMPFEGRWKVFIINDAECMNQESQNKLLKTLEEPPPQAALILVCSQPARLLPTIISRCQRVVFHAIPQQELEQYLVDRQKVEPPKARLLSALSHGQISRAQKLMEEKNLARREKVITILARSRFDTFRELVNCTNAIDDDLKDFSESAEKEENDSIDKEFYQSMSGAERAEVKQQVDSAVAAKYRTEVEEVLNLIAFWYRDMLILKITGNENLLKNVDRIKDLRKLADQHQTRDIMLFLEQIDKIHKMIIRNMKLTFCLQVLLLRLGFLG